MAYIADPALYPWATAKDIRAMERAADRTGKNARGTK